jgi:hypothetical protein
MCYITAICFVTCYECMLYNMLYTMFCNMIRNLLHDMLCAKNPPSSQVRISKLAVPVYLTITWLVLYGKNARNVTYSSCIVPTQHMKMFGKPKDVSSFKAFGCECYLYLNKELRQQAKQIGRARAIIHMGFV